jgi:hypothetical protein
MPIETQTVRNHGALSDGLRKGIFVKSAERRAGIVAVKLIAEYLERAHQFERMASHETDAKLKAEFEKQAMAYHKLAAKRAEETGLPLPKDQPNPD